MLKYNTMTELLNISKLYNTCIKLRFSIYNNILSKMNKNKKYF